MNIFKKSKFMSTLLLGLSLYGFSYASKAYAISLGEAKAKGYISEICNGYVKANDPSYQQLAEQTNKAREAEYRRIATQTNADPAQVAKVAGEKCCKDKACRGN